MPDGLEKIREGCFKESELEEITVPKSVKRLERWAFTGCESLQKVVFEEGSELKEL